jgi:phosphohistidine phosphatase
MKTLYLLRHAKSSWRDPGLPDHDRPLNDRGRKAALTMGRYLRKQRIRPDLVLASTALRVAETLELLLPELREKPPVIRDRSLYLATPDQLLSRLRLTSEKDNNVLIIGHNPGIQEFALHLVGEVADDAAHEARDRMKASFPTAALAVIRFTRAKTWREVGYGKGEIAAFTTPRDAKG